MAQLVDDCFAYGDHMMTAQDALSLIQERLSPVRDQESVGLEQALGRILAEDVSAARDVPPHDNAAVDGFAVYHNDLGDEDTVLPVAGRITAGHPLTTQPRTGTALHIFTGAPMPRCADGSGPDTIVMAEDCSFDSSKAHVRIPPGLKAGANRRRAGEDIRAGSVILSRGHRLGPADLGLAASTGISTLCVRTPLRVGVLSTGDELCPPGVTPKVGQVHDANRYMLIGFLQALGCTPFDLGIIPDTRRDVTRCLRDAADRYDLLVSSGGVSAGEEDHVRHGVTSMGSLYFWRLAIKPGRPLAMGQVGHTPFIGLPGNPVAVAVTFMIFARPAIAALAGAHERRVVPFPVVSAFTYRKKTGRREWLRTSLHTDKEGVVRAHLFPRQGAGILSSITQSDGLIELDEDTRDVDVGQTVAFTPFAHFLC